MNWIFGSMPCRESQGASATRLAMTAKIRDLGTSQIYCDSGEETWTESENLDVVASHQHRIPSL